MAVARGTRRVDIWYLDQQDTKQQLFIDGTRGSYELADGVLRAYVGDRTLIVPLARVILIDDRLE